MDNNPITESVITISEDEIICDDTFTFDGYQVVRGEFFAHINEPSITFNNSKLTANTACVNKLPDIDYVQILVNPEEMKLAIRPCSEDEKDAFLWCRTNKSNGRKKPKQITCRVFFVKIFELMGWNQDCRYKLLGKLIQSNGEYLFVFDLQATEIYLRLRKDGADSKAARIPAYPAEWQNQFGLPVEEHRKSLQVNIFNGYAVFGLKDSDATADVEKQSIISPESEGDAIV